MDRASACSCSIPNSCLRFPLAPGCRGLAKLAWDKLQMSFPGNWSVRIWPNITGAKLEGDNYHSSNKFVATGMSLTINIFYLHILRCNILHTAVFTCFLFAYSFRCLQDIFSKIWKEINRFQVISVIKYIFTLMKRICFRHLETHILVADISMWRNCFHWEKYWCALPDVILMVMVTKIPSFSFL